MEDSVTSSRAKVLDREAIPYIRLMAMAKPVFPLQTKEKNMTVRRKETTGANLRIHCANQKPNIIIIINIKNRHKIHD